MRFEVPQFIEIEDKIFGPFTWKQFVYLAGGAGAALILFFTLPLVLFAMLGIPVMALAGFLAFHQVNNRPFSIFLESVISYMAGTKLYLWKRKHAQVITEERTSVPLPSTTYASTATQKNIASLARKLELDALESTNDHA